MSDFSIRSLGIKAVSALIDSSDTKPLSLRCLAHRKLGMNWTNLAHTQSTKATWLCSPSCLEDLVTIIQSATTHGLEIHALGSGWSYSDCSFDNRQTRACLIDTRGLIGLSQIPKEALNSGIDNTNLWYVKCGTTIESLYENLDSNSQGLQTMGGASGQSIVGAVSTGTHGGDFRIPPLADTVAAIHLVTGAGIQFWIEPTAGITNPDSLRRTVVPQIDVSNVIYDDNIFNAVLVSIGVFGVIYALVLRTRAQYNLVETTQAMTWDWAVSNFNTILTDPNIRFLQLAVSPYSDTCLVTTRKEGGGPCQACGQGDVDKALGDLKDSLTKEGIGDIVAGVVTGGLSFAFTGVPSSPDQTNLVTMINGLLDNHRDDLVHAYDSIMRADWPPATCCGKSFEVMDINRRGKLGKNGPPSAPESQSLSFEVFFPAEPEKGSNALWVAYINDLLNLIQQATGTILAGYIGVRFIGKTRALLGMQQWGPTCSVEVAALHVKNVSGLMSSMVDLSQQTKYRAILHWGQLFPSNNAVDASRYPSLGTWQAAYSAINQRADLSSFKTGLSIRAGLTPQ